MYKRIGKYEIIEELGHGGQATVYKAKDTTLVGKIVALKVLEVPSDKEKKARIANAYNRFKHEAELIAKLDHPQIAQVYDYGLDEKNEIAFYARQYLHGEQLTQLIKRGPLEYEEGMRIIMSIAKVLDYLQTQDVVHRDIKPSNVFMQYDIPMLIDFGLAFRGDMSILSQTGQMVGTRSYISPEILDWDKREKYRYHPSRDWWGLGCIAYEFFTGRKLFEEEESSLLESDIRQGREQFEIEKQLSDNPASLIVRGLLERNPEKRICSAAKLQNLSKSKPQTQPEPKRPPTQEIEYESKSEIDKLRREREKVEEELDVIVEERRLKEKKELKILEERRLKEKEERKLIEAEERLLQEKKRKAQEEQKRQEEEQQQEQQEKRQKAQEEQRRKEEEEENRWPAQTITLSGHAHPVTSVAFSPDGTKLASGSWDNTVKIWSVADGSEISMLLGHPHPVYSVAFSPDGAKLASGSCDKTIKISSVSDGREIRTLSGHSSIVFSVAFSPDGTKLASGSKDETIKIWSVSDGSEIRTLRWDSYSPYAYSVAFSPDGTKLASGSGYETIIWSVSDGRLIRTLDEVYHPFTSVKSVAFSPDGAKLASGSSDKTIKISSVSDGKEIRTLRVHAHPVTSVAFSPDGTKLASGSNDKTIKIWSVSDGREIRTLRGHSSEVWSVAFSPGGTKLASGSMDNTIKIWRIE